LDVKFDLIREEHELRVLRIFGAEREEVTGKWRRLYCLSDIRIFTLGV